MLQLSVLLALLASPATSPQTRVVVVAKTDPFPPMSEVSMGDPFKP